MIMGKMGAFSFFTFSIPCITTKLLQFEPTNTRNFIKIAIFSQLLHVSTLTGLPSGSAQMYKAAVKLENFFRFLDINEFYSCYVQLRAPWWKASEARNM